MTRSSRAPIVGTSRMGLAGRTFWSNMGALRILNEHIGVAADERDKHIIETFLERMKQLDEIEAEEIEADIASRTAGAAVEGAGSQLPLVDESTETGVSDSDSEDQKLEEGSRPRLRPGEVFALSKSLLREPPIQGLILRRGAIVTLIGYLESLISELVHSFYEIHCDAFPCEEKVLSLRDLRDLGTIPDAENHLRTQEVESVLRESIDEQLKYLAKKPRCVKLKPLEEHIPSLIEIAQRRNVIVHNDGRANKLYMARVDPEFVRENEIEEGNDLLVGPTYLSNAIDLVSLVGIIALQQCARKWAADIAALAEGQLLDLVYDSLVEKRYALTCRLAEYAADVEFEKDSTAKVVSVNHAIALKHLGELDAMAAVLEAEDWSAASLRFQVAQYALRDQLDELFEILPKAVAAGEVDRFAMEEWPLFDGVRGERGFQDILETLPEREDPFSSLAN